MAISWHNSKPRTSFKLLVFIRNRTPRTHAQITIVRNMNKIIQQLMKHTQKQKQI